MARKGTDFAIKIQDIEEILEAATQTAVEAVRQATTGEQEVQPAQA